MTLKPTAHGSLAKTPFAHLLLYLQARKLSGTLAIWAEGEQQGQDRILFEEGMLTAMRPAEPAKTLYAALMPLFARESAPYGFYEGQNLLGQSGTLREPIDIHTLLSRGVRVHANDSLIDSVLERVRGRMLRLRSDFAIDRLELNQRELILIEPLQESGATLDTLLGSGVLPAKDAKRTMYLLTLVHAVEAAEGSRSSLPAMAIESMRPISIAPSSRSVAPRITTIAPPRSVLPPRKESKPVSAPPENQNAVPTAPPPPLGLNPADEQRWTELTALHDRLDELTHYELLALPNNAPAPDVQAAYFGLIKKFHPDRLPLSLAPLVKAAQALFERMTEANETLGNAEQRAEYDKAVQGGGGTRAADRTMRNVLESALEFQKAEVHMRRREYAQATALLRSALAKSPEEADYHALHAWLLHLTHPGADAPLEEILRSLDRALKLNARHERSHYYRGVILKRMKRDAEAIKHFRAAAELNPHNVDAMREVRLASMRRDSKPPPAGDKGVLSRLFKK